LDIRRATWYIRWKGGVELHLYNFQLKQSKQGILLPNTERRPEPETSTDTDYDVPADAWQDLDLLAGIIDHPLEDCEPVVSPVRVTQSVEKPRYLEQIPPTVQPAEAARPSPALAFMQGRPAGPVQTTHDRMKALERRVTTQVQKKSTTAPEGRQALQSIAVQAGESNNKENETATKTKQKQKGSRKSPVVKKKAKKTPTTKSNKTPPPAKTITHATVVNNEPVCGYGCRHGGLVGLKQMAQYDTKYCLEKGNYFDSKCCVDCKTSIAEVFAASKNRALLYYCPLDYNIHNLQEDNSAVADTPCACILCIACYFRREEKKQAASGKVTRSSGRGRRQ
jgi:hypothetical protein